MYMRFELGLPNSLANMAAFPMGVEQKKVANNASRVGLSPAMGERASGSANSSAKTTKTPVQVCCHLVIASVIISTYPLSMRTAVGCKVSYRCRDRVCERKIRDQNASSNWRWTFRDRQLHVTVLRLWKQWEYTQRHEPDWVYILHGRLRQDRPRHVWQLDPGEIISKWTNENCSTACLCSVEIETIHNVLVKMIAGEQE